MGKAAAYNRALLAAIPDHLFVLDREGRFLDFLTHREQELLAPREQIINRLGEDILPADVAKAQREALRRLFEEGADQFFEYEMKVQGKRLFYEAR